MFTDQLKPQFYQIRLSLMKPVARIFLGGGVHTQRTQIKFEFNVGMTGHTECQRHKAFRGALGLPMEKFEILKLLEMH